MAVSELDAKLHETYLGHLTSADGCTTTDMRSRMRSSTTGFNQAMHLWKHTRIRRRDKFRMLRRYVMKLVYAGADTWLLDKPAQRALNNWAARKTQLLTGRTVHEECRRRTVDIVAMLRHWWRRRVGEILRSTDDDPRKQQLLPYAELVRKGRLPRYGGLLTDVPAFTSVKQLKRLAGCKPKGSWRTRTGGVAEGAEAEKRALAWQTDDADLKPTYGTDSEDEDEGDKPKPKADTDTEAPPAAVDGEEAADAEKAHAAKIKARDTAEAAAAQAEVRRIAQEARGQQVWIFFHDGGFGKESCRNAQTGEDGCGWGY